MTTRAASKNKTNKKPLETTLGKAPTSGQDEPDLSHVGKPIHTSLFGLRQVLDLYETATEEVQAYITYECDIMYECRICRTIFRSLANFILHKRKYCQDMYRKTKRFDFREQFSEAELLIINEKFPSEECETVNQEDESPNSVQKPDSNCKGVQSKRTLSNILPRLINKQENTLITEECLAEDDPKESKRLNEPNKRSIALEDVNKSCVFQTMYDSKDAKQDFMKTEVMEIHDILENNEAIIGSDGKIVVPEGEKSDALKNNFMCVICNQKFSTKKTLTYHINYKHNDTRKVYQCTECTDTFANTWGVFRHLYKTHRKTTAQVRKLRNQIHSNRIRNDEQIIAKNNKSEVKVSDNTSTTGGSKDQQWIDDLECDNDLQRCGGCGRKFERKAALHSHSQFCTKRIAVCNSIKENNHKKAQEEKQEKKVAGPAFVSPPDGSRKRKPLVAYKILRFDYVKDSPSSPGASNTTVTQNTRELVQSEEANKKESDAKEDEIMALNTIISDLVQEIVNSKSSSTSLDEKSISTKNLDESLQEDVENNNSLCDREKQLKDSLAIKKKCSRALEKKCTDYINKEKKLCLPCDKVFKTYKCLMRHMAIHFNWHRYQCTTCQYTAYQRSKCEHHAEKKHSIVNKEALSDHITHISYEKTMNLSTHFINYAAKKCKGDLEEDQAKKLIETQEIENQLKIQKEREEILDIVGAAHNIKYPTTYKAPDEAVDVERMVESRAVAKNRFNIEKAPQEICDKKSVEEMVSARNIKRLKEQLDAKKLVERFGIEKPSDPIQVKKPGEVIEAARDIIRRKIDKVDKTWGKADNPVKIRKAPEGKTPVERTVVTRNGKRLKTEEVETSNLAVTAEDISDPQDPTVRDMIMKVIFGNHTSVLSSNSDSPVESYECETTISPSHLEIIEEHRYTDLSKKPSPNNNIETSSGTLEEQSVTSNSARCRPVRARTATARGEFLYDMRQILKKPLKVYTRKPKGVPPKANKHSFTIHQNIKPIQVPDT